MHYAVALLHITDSVAYGRYQREFLATLDGTGGRLLAADTAPSTIEGDWTGDKVVILAFPDAAAFGMWVTSPLYRRIVHDRHAGSTGIVLSVRGLSGGVR